MADAERRKKRYCSVPGCRSSDAESLIFHRFPKDDEVQAGWKAACHISKDISVNMFVCGRHFRPEDYVSETDAKVQRLKKGAVPSQNLPHDIPNLIPCELSNILNIKKHTSNEESIMPFQSEVDNIFNYVSEEITQEVETTHITVMEGIKRRCYVPNCENKSSDTIFYHYFPKNNKIRQQWIDVCNLSGTIKPFMSICSAHFCQDDYLIGPDLSKPVLKSHAVPSLNLPNNSCLGTDTKELEEKPLENEKSSNQEQDVIFTPTNNSDLISFIENFTENSSDLDVNYLDEADSNIIVDGLEDVPFDLPENDLHFFQDQNGLNEIIHNQNGLAIEINCDTNIPNQNDLNFCTDVNGDNKSPCDKNNAQVHTNVPKNQSKKIIVKSCENVNIILERNGDKTIVTQKTEEPEAKKRRYNVSFKPGVATTTVCIECGQFCKIEDDDRLKNAKKNPETLAIQTLIELQEVNPTLEDEHVILLRKGMEVCDKILQKENIYLMDLLTNDSELRAFTGINFELLDKLSKLVTLFESSVSTLKHFDCARDRIVMCLCKLRTNLSFSCLAMLFGIRQQLFASYFFTMTRTLSMLLEKTIYWPRTDELTSLPVHFHSYRQAKLFLSCVETQIEKQRCPKCRLAGLSQSRKCETVRLVLGVSLCGLIIFKSDAFKSQSCVFSQTNILEHLNPNKEALMTDDTLNIEAECAERNIKLIKLPKPAKNQSISTSDVELVKNIYAARIFIDRTLQRFKTFMIVQSKVSWRILPYINDVCTIIAGIVNMNNVIPPDESRFQLSFIR